MAVAKYTEMCLFTQHYVESDPSTFEVRYGLDHSFDKPESKVSDEVLKIPFEPKVEGLVQREVNMHFSPAVGYDMGDSMNKWFSDRFGYQVRLVYIGESVRKVLGNLPPNIAGRQKRLGTRGEGLENTADKENSSGGGNGWLGSLTSTVRGVVGSVVGGTEEDVEGVDRGIGFADVAPYLIINTKSWENAQKRLGGEEMDILKFRPNIIVEGAADDFEEDYWAELQVGESKFILTANCARCNSLNVDYSTGKVGEGESGKMLKKLQSDRRVDPGAKYSPVFGRYGFLAQAKQSEEGTVQLNIGDKVEVLKRNTEGTRFGKSFLPHFAALILTGLRIPGPQHRQVTEIKCNACPLAILKENAYLPLKSLLDPHTLPKSCLHVGRCCHLIIL